MYRAFHLCCIVIAGFVVFAGAGTTPSHTGGSTHKTPTPKPKTTASPTATPPSGGKLVISNSAGVDTVYVAPTRDLFSAAQKGAPDASKVWPQIKTLLGGLTNLKVTANMPTPPAAPPVMIVQSDIIQAASDIVKNPYQLEVSVYDGSGSMVSHDSFPLQVDAKTKDYDFVETNYQTRFQALLNRQQLLPQRHANVLLVNESQTDTQTQGTAFNGPVYAAARMIERLALMDLPAERIEDFLAANNASYNTAVANEGGNPRAVVAFNTDEAWRQACKIDANLYAVRYVVQYSETRNPLFGTQRGHAQLNAWLQQCGQTLEQADIFSTYGDATNIGSGGLLSGQYFNALNWGLTRLRVNKWKLLGTSGWWGYGGVINSTILPPTHDTDAEASAVGMASERMICAVAYDIVGQLPTTPPSASPSPQPVFHRSDLEPATKLSKWQFRTVPVCEALKDLKGRVPLFRRQAEATPTPTPAHT